MGKVPILAVQLRLHINEFEQFLGTCSNAGWVWKACRAFVQPGYNPIIARFASYVNCRKPVQSALAGMFIAYGPTRLPLSFLSNYTPSRLCVNLDPKMPGGQLD